VNWDQENISGLCEVVNCERRREERTSVDDIPVQITGTDRAGNSFSERAFVKDVTDRGCCFETGVQLNCGDIISVKPLEPGRKVLSNGQSQLFEVMWAAIHRTGCTVGTRKLQGKKLENAKFPPPDYSPRNAAK